MKEINAVLISRNFCCTNKLENNVEVFLKVTNYEVTLKPISLHTGKEAKLERNC